LGKEGHENVGRANSAKVHFDDEANLIVVVKGIGRSIEVPNIDTELSLRILCLRSERNEQKPTPAERRNENLRKGKRVTIMLYASN